MSFYIKIWLKYEDTLRKLLFFHFTNLTYSKFVIFNFIIIIFKMHTKKYLRLINGV